MIATGPLIQAVLAAAPAAPEAGPNLSALWIVVSLLLHALVSVGVGYLILRIRSRDKTIDEAISRNATRIDRVEVGLSDAMRSSLVHDKKLEVLMNREFVPRDECRTFRGENRETTTRLFAKVESLQKDAAATKAACDGLEKQATDTKSVCDTILGRVNARGDSS